MGMDVIQAEQLSRIYTSFHDCIVVSEGERLASLGTVIEARTRGCYLVFLSLKCELVVSWLLFCTGVGF